MHKNEIIIKITFYYPSSRHDVNDIIQEYIHKKKFEDTKRGSQRRTSKKERQYNGQKKDKMINNGYKNAILYKRCIIYFFVFLFFVVFVFLCLSFTFYVNVFFPLSLPILWQFDKSNTEEAKTAYPSRAPAYTHGFLVGTVLFIILVFVIVVTISA